MLRDELLDQHTAQQLDIPSNQPNLYIRTPNPRSGDRASSSIMRAFQAEVDVCVPRKVSLLETHWARTRTLDEFPQREAVGCGSGERCLSQCSGEIGRGKHPISIIDPRMLRVPLSLNDELVDQRNTHIFVDFDHPGG